MCGVFGFIGNPTKKTKNVIKELGLLNVYRGADSTGLAFITPKNWLVYKNNVHSPLFFSDPEVQKYLGAVRNEPFITILGHTRYATQGATTSQNAHPFIFDNIIMTHNGVISNFNELLISKSVAYEVDSQIIGHLLDALPVDEAVGNLSGSFTVPFVDKREQTTLQVIVHTNPFWFAIRGKQLFYSSERKHLEQALEKAYGKAHHFILYKGLNDTHYKFYGEKWSSTILFSRSHITPKIAPYYPGAYYSGRYYGEDYHQGSTPKNVSRNVEDVKLKDRAFFEGCDICNYPIETKGYYSTKYDTLLCTTCHQGKDWKNMGSLVDFTKIL